MSKLQLIDSIWATFLRDLQAASDPPLNALQIESFKACFYAGAWAITHLFEKRLPVWDRDEWLKNLKAELETTIDGLLRYTELMREVQQ